MTIFKYSFHYLNLPGTYPQALVRLVNGKSNADPETSFNQDAPKINRQVFDAFNLNGGRVDLHKNLQRAFIRILGFYGFELPTETQLNPRGGQKDTDIRAILAPNHVERISNWYRGGHNNRRITRIIRSLRVLGRHDLATIMYHAVESIWNLPQYQKYHEKDASAWWTNTYLWPLCKSAIT